MKDIPSAQDYLQEKYKMQSTEVIKRFSKDLIEFAKLHVTAALEKASEDATTKFYPFGEGEIFIDSASILNSYNLDNIK